MPEASRLLILGGTREAADLAAALQERQDILAISSLAGRTSKPAPLPGHGRRGGFGGAEGLAHYLSQERIAAMIDATHPFAATISANAHLASGMAGVPLLRLERPPWQQEMGDRWLRVGSAEAAARTLKGLARRVLLTTGAKDLEAFAGLQEIWFLVRLIERPREPLPISQYELLLARGPFSRVDEEALMRKWRIEALVTKNSGGEATIGKIVAARHLDLPVIMIERPLAPQSETVASVEAVIEWLNRTLT